MKTLKSSCLASGIIFEKLYGLIRTFPVIAKQVWVFFKLVGVSK